MNCLNVIGQIIIVLCGLILADDELCPSIVSREEWGAAPPVDISYLPEPVDYVFIHHTYIPRRCYSNTTCSSAMRGMQKYHMKTKGWNDIGYSFVFGDDGNVYEGRGWDQVGAHTRGHNTVGLGFSFIGDFNSILPSQQMLENAHALMKCGVLKQKIKSNFTVRGHRDVVRTTCPGQCLYDHIKTWLHYKTQ